MSHDPLQAARVLFLPGQVVEVRGDNDQVNVAVRSSASACRRSVNKRPGRAYSGAANVTHVVLHCCYN